MKLPKMPRCQQAIKRGDGILQAIPLASRGARPEHVKTGRWAVCPARLPKGLDGADAPVDP